MAIYAGDVIDGNEAFRKRKTESVLLELVFVVMAVLTNVVGLVKDNRGILIDLLGFGLIVVGLAFWLGPAGGFCSAGVAVLLLRDFGGE